MILMINELYNNFFYIMKILILIGLLFLLSEAVFNYQ